LLRNARAYWFAGHNAPHLEYDIQDDKMLKYVIFSLLCLCGGISLATGGLRESKYPKAMEIIDEQGKPVSNYCIVYLYAKSSGVVPMPIADSAQGREHDPAYYLKWPQKSYSDYEIHKGIEASIFPPFMFGTSETPVARAILKSGYDPVTWNSYTGREYNRTLILRKGNSERFYNALLSKTIDLKVITELFSNYAGELQIEPMKTVHVRYDGDTEIREPFKPIGAHPGFILKDEFSDDDRNLLTQCY
jgi:hypothetical protein